MKTIEKAIVSPTPPNHDNVFWVDVSGNSPVLKGAINGSWKVLGGASAANGAALTNITYKELKTLRNTSKLIPGNYYRITDYATVTTQENTQSAGHQFDVIVLATDTNALSEDAYAAKHEGDIYFANSNLAAWKLKYCLDNDSTRFVWIRQNAQPYIKVNGVTYYYYDSDSYNEQVFYGWYNEEEGSGYMTFSETPSTGDSVYSLEYSEEADDDVFVEIGKVEEFVIPDEDSFEGRGVIYYMKDEWGNECPYDFKNIQFGRSVYTDTSGYHFWLKPGGGIVPVQQTAWLFTFAAFDIIHNEGNERQVGETLFDGSLRSPNKYPVSYYNNIIKPYIEPEPSSEELTDSGIQYLNDIVFLGYFHTAPGYDVGAAQCSSNNTFDFDCYNITIADNCNNNKFGRRCYNNSIDSECYNNVFDNCCSDNYIGTYCRDNNFIGGCQDNIIGSRCQANVFDSCSYIIMGDDCINNTIGHRCNNIKFGTSSTTKNYYQSIYVEPGNYRIYLNCTATTSASSCYQRVKIDANTNSFESSWKTITDSNVNQGTPTVYKATGTTETGI